MDIPSAIAESLPVLTPSHSWNFSSCKLVIILVGEFYVSISACSTCFFHRSLRQASGSAASEGSAGGFGCELVRPRRKSSAAGRGRNFDLPVEGVDAVSSEGADEGGCLWVFVDEDLLGFVRVDKSLGDSRDTCVCNGKSSGFF